MFSALNDFVPLVPVVALRFSDAGLGPVEVSSLFGLLAVSALLLEVPSGAWADVASRRMLLALGAVLRAGCFVLWALAPSYPAFVAGVLLWGACHALTSGTLEALVYDELSARASAASYPRLLGRSRVGALASNVLATLVAAPLLAVGHYVLVEALSAAVCAATAGAALCLPEARDARRGRPAAEGRLAGDGHLAADGCSVTDGRAATGARPSEPAVARYLAMLRAGLAEVRGDPAVRRAAAVAAVLPAVLVIDEYLPLLVRSTGISTAFVPLLVILAVVGKALGGWLAGPLAGLRASRLAAALAAAAVLLAAGSLGRHPLGILPVALCLGTVQLAIVLSQARLQDAVRSDARATVTSLAGLGTDAVAIAFYVAYGVGSLWGNVSVVIAGFAAVPLLLALVVPRWLPEPGIATGPGRREPAAVRAEAEAVDPG
ncbi:MFS transporter [Streptomyces roseifaciens]|uniref:MFS transporter n=1 Tax=Streptomyces roseifaciens TaxID=1488406 RepID=UPI000717EF6D|nr:MFS transporter [Streptomyces roseifaciens]